MKNLTLLLSCLFISLCSHTNGQGILFSEYRMILKDKQIATLQVCNPTDQTRTYQLSAINKTMDRNGKVIDIADSVKVAYSLNTYLRIFPKRITLEPGGCQEVQLQVKVPTNLSEGEYRSFLHFLPLTTNPSVNSESSQLKGMATNIIFRVGAAIPIIFRKHTSIISANIDSISLTRNNDTTHLLQCTVQRKGTQSLYGNFIIQGISKGEPITLANKQGCAIYAEMPTRKMQIPIPLKALDRDNAGRVKIKINYVDAENKEAKQLKTLCSTEAWVAVKEK